MKTVALIMTAVLLSLSFSSNPADAAEVLSLEECLEIAIKVSTNVGISREQYLSARNDVLRQYGGFLPDARLEMFAGHIFIGPTPSISIDAQGRPIQRTGFDYESYSFSLTSTMNLFDWGVSAKNLSGSKHSATAARYDLQYQKDYVTAVVIRAYYDYLRKKKLREVSEMSVNAAAKNLEQVEAFYRIGSKTRADVLQAKVRLANTQLDMVTARNNEDNAKAYLSSLLNFPMSQEFDIDSSLEIKPVSPGLEEEVRYMLDHRSDLLANRSKVKATQSEMVAAQNSRLPAFSAFLRYAWNDRKFADNANFFKKDYSWSIGVSLSFNIFDRFLTKSSIMNASSRKRIAELQLKQAKLDAILEAKQLILSLDQAGKRITLSEETIKQAEENLRLTEERYRVGAGTILETIEAGVSLTEARASIIEATCDYLIAKADLLRATGRKVITD